MSSCCSVGTRMVFMATSQIACPHDDTTDLRRILVLMPQEEGPGAPDAVQRERMPRAFRPSPNECYGGPGSAAQQKNAAPRPGQGCVSFLTSGRSDSV